MKFLSPEWIEALDAAARTIDPDGLDDVHLVIEHHVGDVVWHVRVADHTVRVEAGASATGPDIRFRSTAPVAWAIATGARPAVDAFMDGELQVGGSYDRMMEQHRVLLAIEDCFAEVRRTTTFD